MRRLSQTPPPPDLGQQQRQHFQPVTPPRRRQHRTAHGLRGIAERAIAPSGMDHTRPAPPFVGAMGTFQKARRMGRTQERVHSAQRPCRRHKVAEVDCTHDFAPTNATQDQGSAGGSSSTMCTARRINPVAKAPPCAVRTSAVGL